MKGKILITPRSYGKTNADSIRDIEKAGYTPVINPYGRIMSKEEMCHEISDCVGIIVGVDPLDKEVLSSAKKLKAVAKYGIGTDNIDLEFCKANGIKVSVTKGANSNAVADYAFSLLCTSARKIVYINEQCKADNWGKTIGFDIYGKTLGILGFGAIGKGVAKRAQGFDMRVLAYDVFWDEKEANQYGVEYAEINEIFKQSDFISLHLPLTDETRNIINSQSLKLMKKTAILINTARGGLIDEKALSEALQDGTIAGAGLDVFCEEPPKDDIWRKMDNVIISSHSAASTDGASNMMTVMATNNILRDLE